MSSRPVGFHLWEDLAASTDWQPGINVARCRRTGMHRVDATEHGLRIPVETCGCGFWGFRDLEGLLEGWAAARGFVPKQVSGGIGLWGFSPADHSALRVIGSIEAGGRVIEGDRGFRAAQARILELYDETANPLVAAAATWFDVPVRPYPWPTAIGIVEIHDRPELPSMVRIWNGDESVTFYEWPGSEVYVALRQVTGFVKVVYRNERTGRTRVPRALRVEPI